MNSDDVLLWNENYPVGTRVAFFSQSGQMLIALTTGPAVYFGKRSMVPLGKSLGLVLMKRIRVLQQPDQSAIAC